MYSAVLRSNPSNPTAFLQQGTIFLSFLSFFSTGHCSWGFLSLSGSTVRLPLLEVLLIAKELFVHEGEMRDGESRNRRVWRGFRWPCKWRRCEMGKAASRVLIGMKLGSSRWQVDGIIGFLSRIQSQSYQAIAANEALLHQKLTTDPRLDCIVSRNSHRRKSFDALFTAPP